MKTTDFLNTNIVHTGSLIKMKEGKWSTGYTVLHIMQLQYLKGIYFHVNTLLYVYAIIFAYSYFHGFGQMR